MALVKYIAKNKLEFETLENNVKKLFEHYTLNIGGSGEIFAEYSGKDTVIFYLGEQADLRGVSPTVMTGNHEGQLNFLNLWNNTLSFNIGNTTYFVETKPKIKT